MTVRTSVLAAAAAAGLTALVAADCYTIRPVVRTGDPVPELGGAFTHLGYPRINSHGQVAFFAQRTGELAVTGLWYTADGAPDTLERVMASDLAVPGAPGGATFGLVSPFMSTPSINDAGSIAFAAPIQGVPGDSPNGLFRYIDGVLSKVAIAGDTAPGIGGQVVFRRFALDFGFTEDDRMSFGALLSGPGVTAANDCTIYMHWFGGLNLVKREGSTAPPLGFGWTWGPNSTSNAPDVLSLVQMASTGRVGFSSMVNTASGATVSRYTGWPGALTHGTLGGTLSPEFHPYLNAQLDGLYGLTLTATGFTFTHEVDVNGDSRNGLWRHAGGSIETIACEGDAGPLGTYATIPLHAPITSFDGTVFFRARFDLGDPSGDDAIVRGTPGQGAVVVLRDGDAAPGYWAGVTFRDTFLPHAVDDANRLYFRGYVQGPDITADIHAGLWRLDPDGSLHRVIRQGQWLTLGDGIERQVINFSLFRGAGLQAGHRPGVNNRGDVALLVQFGDGSDAIVVAAPPGCAGDLDDDGTVGFMDLLALLATWGGCDGCTADLDCDGTVGFADLLQLLAAWGPCP
ncbi:MAG: hypothetical protein KF817_02020 [Phycisphaeraceae bacterium]|nr:hypothetical protein [Phycisphaeraceae bacterium]